jgi:sulfur-oxidizing protein SoxZ
MKIKAKATDGVVQVRMLFRHEMETGLRKDSDGNLVPAHYITEVTASYGGEQVFHAELGPAVSKNPYLSFSFKGEAGNSVQVEWVDSEGMTEKGEAEIK